MTTRFTFITKWTLSSYILVLVGAMMIACGQNKIEKTPTQLTKAFIQDYEKWNDLAFDISETKSMKEADIEVENRYKNLLNRYCTPEKKHQGIAYGSVSDHSLEQEKVIKEVIKGNSAIVTTRKTDPKYVSVTQDYEYHFILKGGRWFLEELYVLLEDEKYESL